jgi:hypothetical protein
MNTSKYGNKITVYLSKFQCGQIISQLKDRNVFGYRGHGLKTVCDGEYYYDLEISYYRQTNDYWYCRVSNDDRRTLIRKNV